MKTPSPEESFPAPVVPDEGTEAARLVRQKELTFVTTAGISVRLLIIAAELTGVWLSRSSVLFADAVSSLFDVLSSIVLLLAIRFAARPPDQKHPFGYGRVEPLVGFQLGIILCVTGGWLTAQNFMTLGDRTPIASERGWIWTIPLTAMVLLWLTRNRILRVGNESRSTALRAEANHFQVDALTSLLTTVTLIVAALNPQQGMLVDHIGAILLGLIMVLLGVSAAWENVHQLLDRIPSQEDFERVRASALSVEGVLDVEKLQIQHAGPDAHVNVDIEVDPEISVAASHLIAQHVRARIQSDWPFVRDVIVHVEPWYEGDH